MWRQAWLTSFFMGSASGLQSKWEWPLPQELPPWGRPQPLPHHGQGTQRGQDYRSSLLPPPSCPLLPPLVSPPSPCSLPLSTPSCLEESFQSQWKVKGKKTDRDQKGLGSALCWPAEVRALSETPTSQPSVDCSVVGTGLLDYQGRRDRFQSSWGKMS